MKRITSISLGSSQRDKAVTTTFAGQEFQVERLGTNGDMAEFRRKLIELDGVSDAFGLGGTDMYIYAAGRRYVFREIEKLASAAVKTPVVDGSGLKNTLERETVNRLQADGIVNFKGANVLLVSGVDRFGMAEALDALGANVIYGDLLFALDLPIPLRSLKSLSTAARLLAPVVTRMPFKMLYPTGEKQNTITPKFGPYYAAADIIAGDFPYIRRYMPDDLKGKTILTNTITVDDVEQLKQRGVKTLITTTPEIDGRSFGTNVMEGVLVTVSGRKPSDLTPDDYLKLLAQLNWQPRVETLNP